ncbi:hypothetical protein FGO68_gene12734 [Halteria grandinella]|uniref:Uncharacterized protein n=1 Tax=Halteria grandinella TaxID=5974 RepID=A0A8J8NDM5_HALGN|nr:hypothetical protein FGO68_gene12734 [Halteria grandinella]
MHDQETQAAHPPQQQLQQQQHPNFQSLKNQYDLVKQNQYSLEQLIISQKTQIDLVNEQLRILSDKRDKLSQDLCMNSSIYQKLSETRAMLETSLGVQPQQNDTRFLTQILAQPNPIVNNSIQQTLMNNEVMIAQLMGTMFQQQPQQQVYQQVQIPIKTQNGSSGQRNVKHSARLDGVENPRYQSAEQLFSYLLPIIHESPGIQAIYCRLNRHCKTAQFPNMDHQTVKKLMIDEYKNLDAVEKSKYEEIHKMVKQSYAMYAAQNTPAPKSSSDNYSFGSPTNTL